MNRTTHLPAREGHDLTTYAFKVVVEPDEDRWRAYVPDLEHLGAATWGHTREEALTHMREVMVDFPLGSEGFANEPEHPRRARWWRGGPGAGSRPSSRRRRSSACPRAVEGCRRSRPSLGVSPGQLGAWRSEHLAAGSVEAPPARKAEQAELQRLEREVERLEEEVEILR